MKGSRRDPCFCRWGMKATEFSVGSVWNVTGRWRPRLGPAHLSAAAGEARLNHRLST